jgi:cytochrome P450
MLPPADPIAAVTHPDPYPYYAEMVAHRPLHRDERLGLWVAASAAAVTAVLTSDVCRVRPIAEPVPSMLVDSPAGTIFGRLVRMNDGARHGSMKRAVTSTLEAMDSVHVAAMSRAWARSLVDELSPRDDPSRITELASRLTAHVIASLLGVPPDVVPQTARWTADFVRGLGPGASAEHLERGKTSARHLLALGRSLLSGGTSEGLLPSLARHGGGQDSESIVANGLGFLSQSYEATTGLIGNTLVALARHREARSAVVVDRDRLHPVLIEVLRHDAPIQNTRRFVAEDAAVAGVGMNAGDAIVLVLAAANRDPAVNPEPARFDPARLAPRTFTFGLGAHSCPGTALATTIAAAGVDALLTAGVALDELAEIVSYRPSVNARIPLFGEETRTLRAAPPPPPLSGGSQDDKH